jgi:hypothetical protein
MRTIPRHKAGIIQANPKMPKNGTFGVVEMGRMGERKARAWLTPMGHLISI